MHLGRKSGLVVSRLNSWSKGCGFESCLVLFKIIDGNGFKKPCHWFLHPILVHSWKNKKNIGSQIGQTDKKTFKKEVFACSKLITLSPMTSKCNLRPQNDRQHFLQSLERWKGNLTFFVIQKEYLHLADVIIWSGTIFTKMSTFCKKISYCILNCSNNILSWIQYCELF